MGVILHSLQWDRCNPKYLGEKREPTFSSLYYYKFQRS